MTPEQRKSAYLVSKYFCIYEFVPPEIFDSLGKNALSMIDKKLLSMADFFRDRFGKSYINDYMWNPSGTRDCGLRTSSCKVGAPKSAHKEGLAIDIHGLYAGYSSIEVITDIKKNYPLWIHTGLSEIEDGTKGWNHLSCRKNIGKLLVFPFYK